MERMKTMTTYEQTQRERARQFMALIASGDGTAQSLLTEQRIQHLDRWGGEDWRGLKRLLAAIGII
jgi:hypothetical protein